MSKETAKPNAPKLERVAALATHLGGQHLAKYGWHTQRQLMSCLVLGMEEKLAHSDCGDTER